MFNKIKIFILILFMFNKSMTNQMFLESSRIPSKEMQLATSATNFNSSKPSLSHDTVLQTSSASEKKTSLKLTASKTETLQNSHATTQRKESVFLATKLSTEPISVMTSAATTSKTLSPSKTLLIPTSIQPSLTLKKTSKNFSKNIQSDLPVLTKSLETTHTPNFSPTMVNNNNNNNNNNNDNSGKLEAIETLSASSTMTKPLLNQPILPSLGINVSLISSVIQETNSKPKIIHLTSANHRLQSSSSSSLSSSSSSSLSSSSFSSHVYQTKLSDSFLDSSQTIIPKSIPIENSGQKTSIFQTEIQPESSSVLFPNKQKPNSVNRNKESKKSLSLTTTMPIPQINSTKVFHNTASSLENLINNSTISILESSHPSTTELKSFLLVSPSPTIQILNTQWNHKDLFSVFPSSSLELLNRSTPVFPAPSLDALNSINTLTNSSLMSPLQLPSTQAVSITPSLFFANASNFPTFSSMEAQKTLLPSSSTKLNHWLKESEILVSSHTGNRSWTFLSKSVELQEKDKTFTSTSTIVSKTATFLIPTLSIKTTTTTFHPPFSKATNTHSKSMVIPPSSGDKSQKNSAKSNDLPTNPLTHSVIHTTETMYYPTRRFPQMYNATLELTFKGKCKPLQIRRTYEHFVDNVQTLICKKLHVGHQHVIVHNLTCASVHIHVTFLNITTINLTGHLQDLIDRNKMNVTVYGSRQELHYKGVSLKMVPFPKSIMEILTRTNEKNTEVVVIVIASVIIVLLVLVGFIVFGRECYRRKRSQTFDLSGTPHVHLKMEDFTLTRIPRTGAWYSDDGFTIQRFSESNGSSIVKSSNGVRKQTAISCISDMLHEKENNGAQLRQFSYAILPSNRKDSQDTIVSTVSDRNFRHSTDSLVARQNTNMHGAVNPIYLGDEFPRLSPPSHADQQPDHVNVIKDNKGPRRK